MVTAHQTPDVRRRHGRRRIACVRDGTYLRWVWPLLAMLGALTIVVMAQGAV